MPNWGWIVIALGLCLIIAWIAYRIWKLVSLRYKQDKLQLPELIDRKHFVTSNQITLPFAGTLAKNPERIYLGIPDFIGSSKTFNHFFTKQHAVSWISFDQPSNDHVKVPSVAANIAYCQNVLQVLHTLRPQAKITLVLEGYSCGLASQILKNHHTVVTEVIYLNPISNYHRLRTSGLVKFFYGIGFLFSWNILIPLHINYDGLTKNKLHKQSWNERGLDVTIKMLWQYKHINKNWAQKNHLQLPQKIIQSLDDPFYSKLNLADWRSKYLTNVDYLEIPDQLHFDLNLKPEHLIIRPHHPSDNN